MRLARRILGLDLGSHGVKAVELRQTLRGLEVAQLRQLTLDDPSPSLASELRDLVTMHDLPREYVVVALAGDRVSTRNLAFPFRDRKKVGAAVPFEVAEQVPFDVADYVIDWEIVGEAEGRCEIAATLAPRGEVALVVSTLEEAGLGPRVVEAEGLALSNLAAVVELPGTRLLADVGHRKTTLCVCIDGRAVAARTIPVAGRAITLALAAERGLGEIEAERVKIEQGVIGAARESRPALEVIDRLARELVRTAGALEPMLEKRGTRLERVDLLGGSAHLHRLDEYLADRTGLRVERLPLPSGELGSAFLAAGDPLLFAPAMALALRGSARAATRMNFRQGDLQARIDLRQVGREMRRTAALAAAALLLGGAALGTQLALDGRRARAAERASREIVTQALAGQPVTGSALQAMDAAVRSAQKRADTLGVYKGNLSALDVLTEISKHVPADLDVVFEELSIDRQLVQIKGHSPSFGSLDRLKAELAKYEPFSEISVGDITSDARRGGQTFSVRISLGMEDGA
jgi:general secretion pathway protein L